ncbi:RNA polymerase sigma factor, sigma-70 family [Enterococcus faecium 13.SD.W.09]|nr:RNA polymerase sigma factor, sigma-70 family [Enterococcus faecium 13.SD.W.09]
MIFFEIGTSQIVVDVERGKQQLNSSGGAKMTKSFESHIQHTFDSYCRTVVRNEARNIKKRNMKMLQYQTSLDYLPSNEKDSLFYFDDNIGNSETFVVDGMRIVITDSSLCEAISTLSDDLQDIVLLYYFVGFSDREIGERYNLSAGSLWSLRKRAVKLLHRYMESDQDE